jgi:hypothetical protein
MRNIAREQNSEVTSGKSHVWGIYTREKYTEKYKIKMYNY